jgi:hypothetical protein
MYRKLEDLGTALLGLFVPKLTARAAACQWYWKYVDSCWQCNYGCAGGMRTRWKRCRGY